MATELERVKTGFIGFSLTAFLFAVAWVLPEGLALAPGLLTSWSDVFWLFGTLLFVGTVIKIFRGTPWW